MSDTSPPRPPQNYVRPDELTPAGPNPFDNGTAEPAPALGDPNGRSLEDVTSIAPPSVYAAPAQHPDAVTAKAPLEQRAAHDAAVLAAEDDENQQLRDAAALQMPTPSAPVAVDADDGVFVGTTSDSDPEAPAGEPGGPDQTEVVPEEPSE